MTKLRKRVRNSKGQFVKGAKYGPRSAETKEAISIANSGSRNGMYNGGKPNCKECGVQIWWGSTYCVNHVKSGERNPTKRPDVRSKMSESAKERFANEQDHPQWKGDSVGYGSLHKWVAKQLGNPQHCSICNDTSDRKYEWANVSGAYLRIKADWIRLCVPCHRRYDFKFNIKTHDRFTT